jgi:hypothetical protein
MHACVSSFMLLLSVCKSYNPGQNHLRRSIKSIPLGFFTIKPELFTRAHHSPPLPPQTNVGRITIALTHVLGIQSTLNG